MLSILLLALVSVKLYFPILYLNIFSKKISIFFRIVAGHSADTLIQKRWSVLSVRRLMTNIGLIGPGAFLLAFCAVDDLFAAVVYVQQLLYFTYCVL